MKVETVNKLCCPFDKSDLVMTTKVTDIDGSIVEGIMLCDNCKRVYPIISGIPIMNPDEYREFALEEPFLKRMVKENFSPNFRLEG